MLESLRDKFQLFKKDVTSRKGPTKPKKYQRNPNTGAEILAKYQRQWMSLHQIAEENAEKAGEIDKLITSLLEYCEKEENAVEKFNIELSHLPKLNESVNSLLEQTEKLQFSFEKVESALASLEDVIEIQEFQEKQLDERFNLAMMKEKKLGELEQLKVQLANAHAERVKAFELKQQSLLKERQETFKVVFEEEMQHYKLHGKIERIPSSETHIPLEEVQIDDDSTELNAFLAEEATEDTFRQSDLIINALADAIEDEDEDDSTKPEIILPQEVAEQ